MPNDDYESCLMLGGDYHGEILRIHPDMGEVKLYPKRINQPARPTDTVDILVYTVTERFNKKGRRYLIAACQPLESFDIKTEMLKVGALLP